MKLIIIGIALVGVGVFIGAESGSGFVSFISTMPGGWVIGMGLFRLIHGY